MKNKTASLDLFHDIELPQQKEDPFFSDMESEDEGGESAAFDAASEMQADISGTADPESEQMDKGFEPFPLNYSPMANFPQLAGMMVPVWVFCPGFPLCFPVMALFPVLICS